MEVDGKDVTKNELALSRAVVEAIQRVAKEAVIAIGRDANDGELTNEQLAAYQEVADSTEILYSRNMNVDRYCTDKQD